MGHAWFANKPIAQEQAARLGISVPFDESTPVATYGSMFIARPAALRPIARGDYRYEEFPGESGYRDGTLAHALERLVVYSALSEGFHARQVLTTDLAATYYSYLEFKLQSISSALPAAPSMQLPYVRRLARQARQAAKAKQRQAQAKPAGTGLAVIDELPPLLVIKTAISRSYPRVAAAGRLPYRAMRRTRSLLGGGRR
jgi:rhamnosyltransferase